MGQIEDLRLFVKTVDSGGIARAAKELGIAKSAVSRRLAQLEERYGVRLIDRQPRVWVITTAGQELYQRAVSIVAHADDLDADFLHVGHAPRGPLSISIAREFGLTFLKPILFQFAEDHPQIDLVIDFDDRTVDLDAENYDLAVRVTASEMKGFNCHRIGTTRHSLFASRAYAEAEGLPKTLDQLTDHPLLHYGGARRASWEFEEEGRKRAVTFSPALRSNDGSFLVDAALRDAGIIRLPLFMLERHAIAGRLVPVLEHLKHEDYGIYVLHSANRRLNKRMRMLMDVLERACQLPR